MLELGYVSAVTEMHEKIAPFIPVRELQGPRWISTPDGDEGQEWCDSCGYYKVRNLRRRDRKRRGDYFLDGGWRSEQENFCFCAGCGQRLEVSLLEYGIINTLECFAECGFSTNPAEDAYEIGEVLHALEYRSDFDGDQTESLRVEALKLAEAYLTQDSTS